MNWIKNKINFFFVEPTLHLKSDLSFSDKIFNEKFSRILFAFLLLIMLFTMPFMAWDSGISGDERTLVAQAERTYDYLRTFGENKEALKKRGRDPMHIYGQSFDLFAHVYCKVFDVENIYEVRHVFNAITGWMAILFVGLIAALLSGYRSAVIAVLLMFFCPRFLGHSFNNPKDIPFALGYIMSLYFIIKIVIQLPKIKWSTAIALALAIAFTNSIRIGGILLMAYAAMHMGLRMIWLFRKTYKEKGALKQFTDVIVVGLGILLVGYFLGISLWPYGLEDPLVNPKDALDQMTKFSLRIYQLFEGEKVWSTDLPDHYIYKILWITIPVGVFSGIAVFFLFLHQTYKSYKNLYALFILAFAVGFPIFWIIYKESNVYNGWRQLLFIFPPAAVLAAFGFNTLFLIMNKGVLKWIPAAAVVFALVHPAKHVFANHPYEYVYYNELSGGMKKVSTQYETDYYQHSIKEGAEWLLNYLKENNRLNEKTKVKINAYSNLNYFFRNDTATIETVYSRFYERSKKDWDYTIDYAGYISPYELKAKNWPTENSIYTVEIDGVPVCSVEKRPSKDDFYGFEALGTRAKTKEEKGNALKKAVMHFEKYLKVNPNSTEVLFGMGQCMYEFGQFDKAIEYFNKSLKIYPQYIYSIQSLGLAYLQKKDFKNAERVFKKQVETKDTEAAGYFWLAQTYLMQKNYNLALKQCAHILNKIDKRNPQAYNLMISIYKQLGNEAKVKEITAIRDKNVKKK